MEDFRINRLLSYSMKSGKTVMLMKQLKNYTGAATIESMLDNQPNKILMSASGDSFTTFEVNLEKGRGKMKDTYPASYDNIIHGPDGRAIAAVEYNMRDLIVRRLDGKKKKIIYETTYGKEDDVPFIVYGLSNDASSLIIWGNRADFMGLKTLSLADGTIEDVQLNGKAVGDAGPILDRHTRRLVGIGYIDDLYTQIFIDDELKAIHDSLRAALPDQTLTLLSWTADRSTFTFRTRAMGQPDAYYLYEADTQSVSPLGAYAPQLNGRQLGSVTAIEYQAADATTIPAYLTLPPGKLEADGPFPLVLMPHGGPEARDTGSYDWWAQAYAAEGYAVLQPNFRGSDGYGFDFRDKGYGELGGKMVTDVLDGGRFLQAQGIANSDGWCVAGASYGGYSALMAGLLDGQNTGCVVSVNGVTDYFQIAGERGSAQKDYDYLGRYLGGTVYQSVTAKKQVSPAERTADYTMPVLLIHGREDTTVPVGQSRRFKKNWGSRDGLRYIELEGSDHYLQSTSARKALLRESIAFLNANHPAR